MLHAARTISHVKKAGIKHLRIERFHIFTLVKNIHPVSGN